MKEAIQKAIEGGYAEVHPVGWILTDNDTIAWQSHICNPLFWQCLGKALGWNGANTGDGRETLRSWVPHWKDEWHRFIDSLASGQSPDDFFKDLLSGTDL